jgi:rRNA maturation RNase YbeY
MRAEVSFLGKDLKEVRNFEKELKKWLISIAVERGFKVRRLIYHFIDNKASRTLNFDFLAHDYATDIITMDHSDQRGLEVEMFLGVEVISDNAKNYGVAFVDELDRVIVHGLLHCIGFDDKTEGEVNRIKAEENICLISRPKSLLER